MNQFSLSHSHTHTKKDKHTDLNAQIEAVVVHTGLSERVKARQYPIDANEDIFLIPSDRPQEHLPRSARPPQKAPE
jgi:hypothetical protein